jgi:hypothetical protein
MNPPPDRGGRASYGGGGSEAFPFVVDPTEGPAGASVRAFFPVPEGGGEPSLSSAERQQRYGASPGVADQETMASAEEETSRLFRIRRTVMQMLDDRGYPVTAADVNLSKAEFIARFNNPTSRDELMIYREKGSQPIYKVRPLSRSVPFRSSAPAPSEPLPCRSEDLRLLPQRGQARREDDQELRREDEAGGGLERHTRRAAGAQRLRPQRSAGVLAEVPP